MLILGKVWSWWPVLRVLGWSAAATVGWPDVTYDPAGNTNSQQDLLLAYQALPGICWTNLSGLEKLHTDDGKPSQLLETVPHNADSELLVHEKEWADCQRRCGETHS